VHDLRYNIPPELVAPLYRLIGELLERERVTGRKRASAVVEETDAQADETDREAGHEGPTASSSAAAAAAAAPAGSDRHARKRGRTTRHFRTFSNSTGAASAASASQ
jgi:hypothetical protein